MKKIIIAFILLLLLAAVCIYLFIPGTLVVTNIATVQCSVSGANRVIDQKENWKKFWAGESHTTPQISFEDADFFTYQTDTFRITKLSQNAVIISISGEGTNISSTLQIIPLPEDSIALRWSYSSPTSINPIRRLLQYQQAVNRKKKMDVALTHLKNYLGHNENIYGTAIERTSTVDTFLVSTKAFLNVYPSTEQIYSLIAKLQVYAKENGALQSGYPMMNITQPDKNRYAIMVAIPVNKMLAEKGDIAYKRMIPGGFLTTTVTGGNEAVKKAYQQMEQYFQDYRNTAMAIPFMYLITDRSRESDTSKWVTKLYFPVM